MKLRSRVLVLLLPGLLWMPAARAAPPTSVQIEVSFLLGYVEGSRCEFYRNGTWHDSRAAQAHLREKYKYLLTINLIDTTEQFIDRAASQSSLTGDPYLIRCNGGASVASKQWLREELARLRGY